MDTIVKHSNQELIYPDEKISNLLKSISIDNLNKRKNKTSKKNIYTRVGKDNKSFRYIKPKAVYQWLDQNYPLWSMEVIHESYKELSNFINIAVRLTVIDPVSFKVRVITRYGSKEAILKKDTKELVPTQYIKAAETDALKRCVVALGGFNDVYMDSEDLEIEDSTEKRNWYVKEILPKMINKELFKESPHLLFEQMLAFDAGKITKEQLINSIND